jgi:predicted dehydrogenase
MAEKVRLGVVGTSWWADGFLLPSITSESLAQLVAICGRNEERAREMATKYQIAQVFTDYREMIDRVNLEAIVVATPDDLHCEITLAAIDAGLHVLCEKPLALTAAQAKEMYERAESAGVKHMTHLELRTWPPLRYLHRLVAEGYVGRCLSAEFRYVGSHGRSGDYHWRFDRKRSLGILGDFGPHVIDLARWLVGDIAAVSAHLAACYERRGPDGAALDAANDSALLLLEFASGGHGNMNLSAVAHTGDRGLEARVVLHGESGTLEWKENNHGYQVYGAKGDETTLSALPIPEDILGGIDPQSPVMQQFLRMSTEQSAGCRLFVEAIAADRKITPSFYEGFKAQEVIEAALASDQKRQFVSLSVP